jgi:hypothetical protein
MSTLNNSQLPNTLSSKTVDNTNTINTTTTNLSISGGSSGQVLSTNGGGILSWLTVSSGATIQTDIFLTSGTYTKPAWAKYIIVYLLGAGSGGGSGRRGNTSDGRSGGSGGGGNAWNKIEFLASYIGNIANVTIGAGGLGGQSRTSDNTDGQAGGTPGNTLFNSWSYSSRRNFNFVSGGSTSDFVQSPDTTGYINPYHFATPWKSQTNFPNDGGRGRTTNGEDSSPFVANQTEIIGYSGCGGGGGGANASSTTTATGGNNYLNFLIEGQVATRGGFKSGNTSINGQNGSNGSYGLLTFGTGGGGGGYQTGVAGGNGGNGGIGAGGGGGGASDNGFPSGKGGDGGSGCIVVLTLG